MDDLTTARPFAGRWIALEVRSARPLTLLGPAWAALCGVIASGGLNWRGQSILFLLLAVLLCDALLGAWRALWLESDWRAAMKRLSASAVTWLDVSPDTSQSRWGRGRERLARWWAYVRQIVWPTINSEVVSLLIAGALALCLAVVLGQAAVALTASAMLLAIFESEIGSPRGAGVRALFEIALPWLIGQSVFGFFSWLSLFLIVLFTLVYRALFGLATTRQARWIVWSNLAQLTIVLALVAANAPIAAGVAALGLLAQILWQARYHLDRDGVAYARRVQSYVMVAMLMTALAVWL
jgi:hypothetical protein